MLGTPWRHWLLISVLLVGLTPCVLSYHSTSEALEIITRAKAKGTTGHEEALELVKLAWPETPTDPVVSALAREDLIKYSNKSTAALRAAIRTVPPRYSADVLACLLENNKLANIGLSYFQSALNDALWYGSTDAKRIAIPVLASIGHKESLLAMIDSATEDPILILPVLEAMGQLGSDKARFFLQEVLDTGNTEQRLGAAHAMTKIGNRSLEVLRDSILSDDPEIRSVALDVILPISSTDDLSVFHEYARRFSAEDPKVWKRLLERVSMLEQILEAKLVH